ncbi:MAG TPA: isoprenyl transferase [Clostridiales bacterium]|nr:isoprenyl transferase [Clostridiales bacterium]
MAFFKKSAGKKPDPAQLDLERLPRHVAIIMDGNGRWAKKRGLPRTAGHAAGAETFRTIATYAKNLGMDYLTVYAFSTENWKRPEQEVSAIMGLLEKYLHESIETMARDKIKMAFLGDLSPLSPKLQQLCRETEEISKGYEGFQANICLNYGGRDEIVRAAKAFAAQCAAGTADPAALTEEAFGRYLYSADIPDPDLIIRPSGEVRISNFLLWQSAYAEFYFTDVLWPDFSKEEFNRALAAYQNRSRRFGGV